jgi:hypothetical protein
LEPPKIRLLILCLTKKTFFYKNRLIETIVVISNGIAIEEVETVRAAITMEKEDATGASRTEIETVVSETVDGVDVTEMMSTVVLKKVKIIFLIKRKWKYIRDKIHYLTVESQLSVLLYLFLVFGDFRVIMILHLPGRGNGRARDSRRERKSRWGGEEDTNSQNQPETENVGEATEQQPQQTQEIVAPTIEKENQAEMELPPHQQQESETEHQEQHQEVLEPHHETNGDPEHVETCKESDPRSESEPMNDEPSYEPEESSDSRFEREASGSPRQDLDRQQPSQEPESPCDSESQQESDSRFNYNESSQHQPDSPFDNDQQNSRQETDSPLSF